VKDPASLPIASRCAAEALRHGGAGSRAGLGVIARASTESVTLDVVDRATRPADPVDVATKISATARRTAHRDRRS
jgi:hypothetical protein